VLRGDARPREVSEHRRTATAADLREAGSTDIRRADELTVTGTAMAGGAGVLEVADSWLPKLEKTSELAGRFSSALGGFKEVIADNLPLIVIVAGVTVVVIAWRYRANRVERHRDGAYLTR
jgi:hypothetical protein